MVAGITDKELSLLVEGRWFDDYSGTPGWERTVKDEDGKEMWQSVSPSRKSPGWLAEGSVSDSLDEALSWCDGLAADCKILRVSDSLDEVLLWCDDRAADCKILPAEGAATKQEERFAAFSEQIK